MNFKILYPSPKDTYFFLLRSLRILSNTVLFYGDHEATQQTMISKLVLRDFPGGVVVKSLPANAGDMGLSPDPGESHMLQSG